MKRKDLAFYYSNIKNVIVTECELTFVFDGWKTRKRIQSSFVLIVQQVLLVDSDDDDDDDGNSFWNR